MAGELMVAQCKLRQGTSTLVSWLDTKKKFKVGSLVTLKGLEGKWKIESIGRIMLANNINRDWNNNI